MTALTSEMPNSFIRACDLECKLIPCWTIWFSGHQSPLVRWRDNAPMLLLQDHRHAYSSINTAAAYSRATEPPGATGCLKAKQRDVLALQRLGQVSVQARAPRGHGAGGKPGHAKIHKAPQAGCCLKSLAESTRPGGS